MTYRMFIDDERFPPANGEWVIVRNSSEAVAYVKKNGIPSYISFDHDLGVIDGTEDTSMKFLHWLIEHLLDINQPFPDYYVHSQNPIGKHNIIGIINSFQQFIVQNA